MGNRKLVVYYTYTGHTKYIAEIICEKLNCDILEIKPIKQYSEDYDLVVNEHQNNESTKKMPELEKININLNNYDEIIVGSPVWWYTIAPPIRTFLKQNDFAGKIIIPFATNAGWLGRTFKEVKSLCSNSEVKNEMNIVFTEDYTVNELVTSSEELEKWLSNL